MEGPSRRMVLVLLIVRLVHNYYALFEIWSDSRTVAPDFNLT